MENGVDAFDLVALLKSGISVGGADGVRVGVSCVLEHFFQMSMPMRKMASAIPIIPAEEVNIQ